MIFQHTLDKVLSGKKTQTRRLIKGVNLALDIHGTPGATDSPAFDALGPIQCVTTEAGRLLYEVGHTYSVQAGRGHIGMWFTPDGQPVDPITRYWDYEQDDTVRRDNRSWMKEMKYYEARICITAIRREDVRNISEADARAEGFESPSDFLATWCTMHDSVWAKRERCFIAPSSDLIVKALLDEMRTRPSTRYTAWALSFELVRGGK